MSNDHVKEMLRRLGTVFGLPKNGDTNDFFKEYYILLNEFSAAELNEATNEIMKTHVYKSWPTVAECLKAVVKARNQLATKDGIPMADVKGTGWRISGNTGKQWYRIERGSLEFLEWVKYFRVNGFPLFSSWVLKQGFTFVMGPSTEVSGKMQIAFMNANSIGGKDK